MTTSQSRSACVLGFDTSAYTTSIALVAADGTVIADQRRLLVVPHGQRGLRQSDALFQHVNHLPKLLEAASAVLTAESPIAVAASETPRHTPDSYMPVFRAGASCGRSVAAALGVPFSSCSHQEGHLWAAFLAAEEVPEPGEPFLAVQISGGTTEALRASLRPDGRVESQIVGVTSDLTAGKFVDRIGVALGLPFPAGAHLERLSRLQGDKPIEPAPTAVKGTAVSFSGPLTALERRIQHELPEALAAAAEEVLASSLVAWSRNVLHEAFPHNPPRRAYWVGGVASNQAVRERVTTALEAMGVEAVRFAPPSHSTDNALGVAYWAACSRGRG